MTVFVLLGGVMVALCLALVVVPIWRAGGSTSDRRRDANVEIYRQRCAEIDREVAAYRLSESDAEEEKDELGARLLADIDAKPGPLAQSSKAPAVRRSSLRPWLASLLLGLFIVTGAAGGYGWLAGWQAIDNARMPNIDQMMARLEAQVQTHPEDRRARLLLAQVQRRRSDNAAAAANLRVLNQGSVAPNTDLLAAEAQATLAAGGDLSGRAGDLYHRLLEQDPTNREALWYLGLRAAELSQNTRAIDLWGRLLEQQLSAEDRAMVSSRRNTLVKQHPASS